MEEAIHELRSNAPGRAPLVGLRHQAQDEPDPNWLIRADVIRGLSAATRQDLVIDLLVRPPQWRAALSLVNALPDATFVLDHAGKPPITDRQDAAYRTWLAWIQQLALRPNVACKISGLVSEAREAWRTAPVDAYVRDCVETFGPNRTMFGSDWPVSSEFAAYDEVVHSTTSALAGFDTIERDLVLSGTAQRVYLDRAH